MLLRAATTFDAIDIATVHVRSWPAGYRGLLPHEYLDGLQAQDRAARYRLDNPDPNVPTTTVALADGAIRGFVAVSSARDDPAAGLGEVCALYVDPDWWGAGVGRLLLMSACEQLRSAGFAEGLLWVLDGNERAVRFYGRHGWREDGSRRRNEIWGVHVDESRCRTPLHGRS